MTGTWREKFMQQEEHMEKLILHFQREAGIAKDRAIQGLFSPKVSDQSPQYYAGLRQAYLNAHSLLTRALMASGSDPTQPEIGERAKSIALEEGEPQIIGDYSEEPPKFS